MPPCRPPTRRPQPGAGAVSAPVGSGGSWGSGGAWGSGGSGTGRPRRSSVRPVLAAVAVVAVVAAVVLAVWRIGNPPTVAVPRPTVTASGSAAPSATDPAPVTPAPTALSRRLPGRARALLHPAARLVAVRRQRQAPSAPRWRCPSTTRSRPATASPSRCARPRRPSPPSASARSSSTPAGPAAPGSSTPSTRRSSSHPAVRAAYDIVGFDPRGIGASSPVRCLSELRHGPALQRRPDARLGGRAFDAARRRRRRDEALRGARWRPGDAHEHDRGRPRHGRHAGAPRRREAQLLRRLLRHVPRRRSTPTPSRRRSAGWCSTRRCRRTRPSSRR